MTNQNRVSRRQFLVGAAAVTIPIMTMGTLPPQRVGDAPLDQTVQDLIYDMKFGTRYERERAVRLAPLAGSAAIPHLTRLTVCCSTDGVRRGAEEAIRRIARLTFPS